IDHIDRVAGRNRRGNKPLCRVQRRIARKNADTHASRLGTPPVYEPARPASPDPEVRCRAATWAYTLGMSKPRRIRAASADLESDEGRADRARYEAHVAGVAPPVDGPLPRPLGL